MLTDKHSISLIIPAFNCASSIEKCIQAILKNTLLPNEIIIVDDASIDNTWNIIQQLAKKHELIKCFRQKRNEGPGKTRNKGAENAQSNYLFFLDSDTQILPDALERFMQQIKTVDAVVGVYDAKPINTECLSAWYKALLYAHLHEKKGMQPYDQFSSSCAGIKRSVYQNLQGYNEWFKAGVDFENEEFGHRITAQYKMIIDPSIKTAHTFPGIKKMTKTFFNRTALWAEMFSIRRKFNVSINSSGMGVSTMSLLACLVSYPLIFFSSSMVIAPLFFYIVYLRGYGSFFLFVKNKHPKYLYKMFLLSHYYSLVIALGACVGLKRVLLGHSSIFNHFKMQQPRRM